MEFLYKKLSKKRLEEFKPSKTLGEELKIQRNYYDIVSNNKMNTDNKSARLNSFLKKVTNGDILDKWWKVKELDRYLNEQYKKVDDVEIHSPARITELEKEKNPKLDVFNRSNYFTSYYFLFRLYGFLSFDSLIRLLRKYNVKFKYSNIKILDLPNISKPRFSILECNEWGYNFYSFIVPLVSMLNEQEQVEVSLNIREPSYFIKDILNKEITTITYDTARKLLDVLDINISGEHNVNDLLRSFNILDSKTYMEEKKIEEHLIEQDYEILQDEQKMIPTNFGYIYNVDSYSDFSFARDLHSLLDKVYVNLEKYIDESLSSYDVNCFLDVFKVLTSLECLTNNIKESKEFLKLPLNEDIKKITELYGENISKEYYSKPLCITLLDTVNVKEKVEDEEGLEVCIPKLVIDYKDNSNKYTFTNYFKEIYKKK
ncbi:MAG: hypothetical protein ACLUWN_02710 [Clostridia bacterium]